MSVHPNKRSSPFDHGKDAMDDFIFNDIVDPSMVFSLCLFLLEKSFEFRVVINSYGCGRRDEGFQTFVGQVANPIRLL